MAVVTEEGEVTEMLRVEVEVVAVERKAKAEVGEENQEVVVENHLVEAANVQDNLMLVLVTYLSKCGCASISKIHPVDEGLSSFGCPDTSSISSSKSTFQRCNGACHLHSQ